MAKPPASVTYPQLLDQIKNTIESGRKQIELTGARTHWKIGAAISKHLLHHNTRAGYGQQLYQKLSKDLNIDERTLQQTVKFSRELPIPGARSQLAWTHYRKLITVGNPLLRTKLLKKAGRRHLSTRHLALEIKNTTGLGSSVQGLGSSSSPLTPKPYTLTPQKGRLNIYQSLKSSSLALDRGQVLIDQGFNVWKKVSKNTLAANQIVSSRDKMSFTYKAFVEEVIDGDTLWVTIDLGLDNFTRQKLRLRGIDCPEANTAAGKKAKAFVVQALSFRASRIEDRASIIICSSKSDKYDRYLADLFYGEEEKFLNQQLLDEGLAVPYKE